MPSRRRSQMPKLRSISNMQSNGPPALRLASAVLSTLEALCARNCLTPEEIHSYAKTWIYAQIEAA
jgi:hypothetical protein